MRGDCVDDTTPVGNCTVAHVFTNLVCIIILSVLLVILPISGLTV